MPSDQDTAVKLLDAKIRLVFDLLKVHPIEDAMSILENVKIQLELLEGLQQERSEAVKKIAALEAEAEVTTPA